MVYEAEPNSPWLILAHGAGAGEAHPWIRLVADGLRQRGVSVLTFDFPYMAAGRRLPDRGAILEDAFRTVWTAHVTTRVKDGAAVFAGGKSMGGRIASQAMSRALLDPAPTGLVFFGYPLHPPRRPDERRDRHLPAITAPMYFAHGSRDPFGSPDEMRALVAGLPGATLDLVEGGGHSLDVPRRDDPDNAALPSVLDRVAGWIHGYDRAR